MKPRSGRACAAALLTALHVISTAALFKLAPPLFCDCGHAHLQVAPERWRATYHDTTTSIWEIEEMTRTAVFCHMSLSPYLRLDYYRCVSHLSSAGYSACEAQKLEVSTCFNLSNGSVAMGRGLTAVAQLFLSESSLCRVTMTSGSPHNEFQHTIELFP